MHTMLAVSRSAKVFADRSFQVESEVLPNVIKVDSFMGAQGFDKYADKPTIVFLGRLVARKGCIYLLRAVNYIVVNKMYDQPFRALICGKGELADTAHKFVADNNLQNYVEFTGFVDESDKPRYVASSDIAVYPSTGGESFGIVLLEAMAATKGVVLGGNNPGYATVLEPHQEQLFNPKDIHAFATMLVRYMSDDQLRSGAAEWQREYVQQFDVNVVGNKLFAVYETAQSQVHK
jgi:phosphatidylinositol alpha-mannosyltransferase